MYQAVLPRQQVLRRSVNSASKLVGLTRPSACCYASPSNMEIRTSMTDDEIKSHFYKHELKCLSAISAQDIIRNIGTITEAPMENSIYVKPVSIMYQLNGRNRRWDMVQSHASVGVVLYNIDQDAFIIVRQFRPAVYGTFSLQATATGTPRPHVAMGLTHELCAGILDKNKSLEQTCSEEIHEECGYNVPAEDIQSITTFLSNTGTGGAPHHMFYAQVDDSMRVTAGGGEEASGEMIEVLALPVDNTDVFILDSSLGKSAGLMFGLKWAVAGMSSGALKRKGGAADTTALNLAPVVCA